MIEYFARTGEPITVEEYLELQEDEGYRRIAKWEGEGGVWVSTVWLGLNHSFIDGYPLIFETMVFGLPGVDNPQMRYCTEAEARRGHERTVFDIQHGRKLWFLCDG